MLEETVRDRFEASCESCGATAAVEGLRELAILRLMRDGWRVRTEAGDTSTWCPSCRVTPSTPVIKPR